MINVWHDPVSCWRNTLFPCRDEPRASQTRAEKKKTWNFSNQACHWDQMWDLFKRENKGNHLFVQLRILDTVTCVWEGGQLWSKSNNTLMLARKTTMFNLCCSFQQREDLLPSFTYITCTFVFRPDAMATLLFLHSVGYCFCSSWQIGASLCPSYTDRKCSIHADAVEQSPQKHLPACLSPALQRLS